MLYLSHTITKDIVDAALAAFQVLPCEMIPIWNAIAAGVDTAKQSPIVTLEVEGMQNNMINIKPGYEQPMYAVD